MKKDSVEYEQTLTYRMLLEGEDCDYEKNHSL